MSKLDRRLQLLLDDARYALVAEEAERSGRSVAAVIRGAIDLAFPTGDERRVELAGELLALTASPVGPRGEGPHELKEALAQVLDDKLSRT